MGLCESPQGPCKTGETILVVCELTVNDDKTAAHGAFCTAENKSEKEFIQTHLQHLRARCCRLFYHAFFRSYQL